MILIIKWIGWHINGYQLASSATPAITQWIHEQSGDGGRDGSNSWVQQQTSIHQKELAVATSGCPVPEVWTNSNSMYGPTSQSSQLPFGWLITLNHFSHGGATLCLWHLFHRRWIYLSCTQCFYWKYLWTDIKCLFTTVVFQIALLLISDVIITS